MIDPSSFPLLADSSHAVTSPPDEAYNCIAWAAGKNDEWWEPIEDQVWPNDALGDYSLAALARVFADMGYTDCGKDVSHEAGFQKICLFGFQDEFLHAARQLKNGQWTSKIGPDDDIRHDSPRDLENGIYENVEIVMKRPYPREPVLGDEG